MKLIQVLKDRITHFQHQKEELEKKHDCKLEDARAIAVAIREYDEEIAEMELAIIKLQEPTNE